MKIALAAVLVTCSAVAPAGIYKCEVDGRTTFSQLPCGEDAQEVTVRTRTRETPTPVDPANPIAPNTMYADKVILERKIRDKEREIGKYQRQMDAELARLKATKSYATNSLAGATWEQSISVEMQAVTAKFQAKIDISQTELQLLRERLNRME